jgi:hypothetical protein
MAYPDAAIHGDSGSCDRPNSYQLWLGGTPARARLAVLLYKARQSEPRGQRSATVPVLELDSSERAGRSTLCPAASGFEVRIGFCLVLLGFGCEVWVCTLRRTKCTHGFDLCFWFC